MKALLIVLSLIGSSAFAACPSTDEALKDFKAGRGTNLDVYEALLCNVELDTTANMMCGWRTMLRTKILEVTTAAFNIGELTRVEVDQAAKNLSDTMIQCNN